MPDSDGQWCSPALHASVPTSGLRCPALQPEEETDPAPSLLSPSTPENLGQEPRETGGDRGSLPDVRPQEHCTEDPASSEGTPPGRLVPQTLAETTWGTQTGEAPPTRPDHSRSPRSSLLTAGVHFLWVRSLETDSPGQVAVCPLQQVSGEVCSSGECGWRPGCSLPPLVHPNSFPPVSFHFSTSALHLPLTLALQSVLSMGSWTPH